MVTGFVPSYVFNSGIGKKIAKLKGLEEGWHYPTFLVQYLRNPAPLLLFDEIVVDEEAAMEAIKYVSAATMKPKNYESHFVDKARPTKSEVDTLRQLLESSLFKKRTVADMITEDDFERIREGYDTDMWTGQRRIEFRDAVAVMEKQYSPDYAKPTPKSFEAMNINVTWVLLEKMSAAPLDDILRSRLYEYKLIQTVNLGMRNVNMAYSLLRRARKIMYLPTEPIQDVDTFLALYKDPRVKSFREKVSALSESKATTQKISQEISKANRELEKLDVDTYGLVVGLLGLAQWMFSFPTGNFATGSVTAVGPLLLLAKEIRKAMRTSRYGWLDVVKGLCEV